MLTQLPEKYTNADSVLTADVIGFNRTYQWYGSFTADNTTGAPIDGATLTLSIILHTHTIIVL